MSFTQKPRPLTVLCLASYAKGAEFMRECKRQAARVLLLTSQSIGDSQEWPRESIDEVFLVPDVNHKWQREDVIKGVSYLARREAIDRIAALDDFDLETAAALREHLRVPGMGETTTRYFRDKLAMRLRAQEAGLLVPDFVHVLNYEKLSEFTRKISPPWMLKPRFEAGAIGIKKVNSIEELWLLVEELGDRQSLYLLESYIPGDIFHVDSIVAEREVIFSLANRYGHPPLDVTRGGIFTTRTMPRGSADEQALLLFNRAVLGTKNLLRGVSHTEFIKGAADGRFYFLETSARVGGANIADLIEAASGLNLWAEWAKIELAGGDWKYELPDTVREDYAGLIVSLARQEYPDTSAYQDAEIVWRMQKRHHAGLIIKSHDPQRIEGLLDEYTARFYRDFFTTQPPLERAME